MTLITADRCGFESEIEDTYYIQISDVLAKDMIECLKEHVNPRIKIYNNVRNI